MEEDVKENSPIYFYSTRDRYGVFSNFFRRAIRVRNKRWRTSEHFYQAMKFEGTHHERAVMVTKTPGEAAKVGRDRSRPLREDWESVKEEVMYEALRAKFTQHADLQKTLLSTGERQLIEHTSRDSYWGDGGDGNGKNRLGHLLMRLRTELREEDDASRQAESTS